MGGGESGEEKTNINPNQYRVLLKCTLLCKLSSNYFTYITLVSVMNGIF
jgi:hypothetical protein